MMINNTDWLWGYDAWRSGQPCPWGNESARQGWIAASTAEQPRFVGDAWKWDPITCGRCGATTADPDKWDPDAETGDIFCDACWPSRHLAGLA